MADWVDEIDAQADETSPFYLLRLTAEIRRLRKAALTPEQVAERLTDEVLERVRYGMSDAMGRAADQGLDGAGIVAAAHATMRAVLVEATTADESKHIELRRMDTPESRAFWACVRRSVEQWEAQEPEWSRALRGLGAALRPPPAEELTMTTIVDGKPVTFERTLPDPPCALCGAAPPSAWQPIETAPKDAAIVLWIPQRFPSVAIGSHWTADDGTKWGWWDRRSMVHPTHWMPLPPAPPRVSARPRDEDSK